MIRVLLVDAGGLLFNNVTEETDFLEKLADRYGAEPAVLRRELDQRDAAYETDTRHVHDVLADCLVAAGAGPVNLDTDWIDRLYLDSVYAYRTVFDHLSRLRSTRPQLTMALANNEAAHWDRLKNRRYGHLGRFDVIGSSWRLRAIKPGNEYFDRLLAACRCRRDEALLVDDNPDVIGAAALLGIGTLHITDPGVFQSKLVSTGWAGGQFA